MNSNNPSQPYNNYSNPSFNNQPNTYSPMPNSYNQYQPTYNNYSNPSFNNQPNTYSPMPNSYNQNTSNMYAMPNNMPTNISTNIPVNVPINPAIVPVVVGSKGVMVTNSVNHRIMGLFRSGHVYLKATIFDNYANIGQTVKIQVEVNCLTSAKIDNLRVKLLRVTSTIVVGSTQKVPKDVLGTRDYWPDGRFPMRESRWEGYIDFDIPNTIAVSPSASFKIEVTAKMETGNKSPKVQLPILLN